MTEDSDEELELGAMMWPLYQLVYGGFLDQDLEPLLEAGVFDPARIVVSRAEAERVLCALGNVAGALMFRDPSLQKWFTKNLANTCRMFAEAAKTRQQ